MVWIWISGATLIGLLMGAYFGWHASQKTQAPLLGKLRLNMASDRELALSTLRREIANYIVRRDPDRYLWLYRKARAVDIEINGADKATKEAQFASLTEKYPFYQDFDLIGTRNHVLYADALNMHSMEDIEVHYLNMVKFHALQCALNEDWQFRAAATSQDDLDHLENYVQRVKDTKFKQRLDAAIREFRIFTSAHQLSQPDTPLQSPLAYNSNTLSVRHIPHFAEGRTGFHFKDTNEFALYGVFFADHRDKPYENYYRSDVNFETELLIDDLRIDEMI